MKIVDKPWGREIWWAVTERYVGKIIEVNAGHALSLQYHERKMETLYFEHGSGILTLDDQELEIEPGLSVTIVPGQRHRITARSDVRVLEASTPETDDVVRLEDRYGRLAEGRL